MSTIPTTEPASVTAGDTIQWTKALPDYPASAGWVLSYAFTGPGNISITSTASGDDHAVTVTAANSADWVSGSYIGQAYVTKAATSERYTVATGLQLTVAANLATASGLSWARRCLAAIQAVLEGKAGSDLLSTRINDKELRKYTPAELIPLYRFFEQEVAREDQAAKVAAGLSSGNRVLVRF
jgi:hypothetical protein